MKYKTNKLFGQNLLRHKILEYFYFRNNYIIISDSIDYFSLLYFIFNKNKYRIVFHPLELYTFSFRAYISELKYRFVNQKISLKFLISWVFLLLKLILFNILLSTNDLIIISSDLRKKYLLSLGYKNNIRVIRNKPIIDRKINFSNKREEKIVLVGNLNNRNDFLRTHNFAKSKNIYIYCYGISNFDKEWIINARLENVIIESKVSHNVIEEILLHSKYALCLYSNHSINQKYSASSKIFEILSFGAIPIISDNIGLIDELEKLKAEYILVGDFKNYNNLSMNNVLNYNFTFESEIDELKK